MAFLFLLERWFILTVIVVVFFQVFVPILQGRQLFPFFRKVHKLEKHLSEVNEDVVEAKIEKEILRRKEGK